MKGERRYSDNSPTTLLRARRYVSEQLPILPAARLVSHAPPFLPIRGIVRADVRTATDLHHSQFDPIDVKKRLGHQLARRYRLLHSWLVVNLLMVPRGWLRMVINRTLVTITATPTNTTNDALSKVVDSVPRDSGSNPPPELGIGIASTGQQHCYHQKCHSNPFHSTPPFGFGVTRR